MSSTTCRKIRIVLCQLDVGYPLVATIVAGIGSITSFLTEKKALCTPDCKLWIAGAACRYFLSFILCFFIGLVRYNVISYSADLDCIIKLADIIDVLGILWFTIGNLLIFTSDQSCATNQKICFSFAVVLVASVYLVFFFPVLLNALIKCYHEPNDPSQNDQAADGRNRALELTASEETTLSEVTVYHWINWLEARGCVPFDYSLKLQAATESKSADDKVLLSSHFDASENDEWGSKSSTQQQKVVELDDNNNPETTAIISIPKLESNNHLLQCPICLDTLLLPTTSTTPKGTHISSVTRIVDDDEEAGLPVTSSYANSSLPISSSSSSSMVPPPSSSSGFAHERLMELDKCVAFPCRSHHLFHCLCLIEWLQSSTLRQIQRGGTVANAPIYTCPCCREQEPGELSCSP